MTSFRQGDYDSREAAADLSTKTYFLVKTDAAGKYVLAAAATDNIRGVLVNAPKLGDTADVANVNGSGTYKAVAGAAFAKDALLTSDANGRAIAATQAAAGVAPTTRVFGRARSAATALNDIVEYDKVNFLY